MFKNVNLCRNVLKFIDVNITNHSLNRRASENR